MYKGTFLPLSSTTTFLSRSPASPVFFDSIGSCGTIHRAILEQEVIDKYYYKGFYDWPKGGPDDLLQVHDCLIETGTA